MLKTAKRLYILVPVLGLISLSQVAHAQTQVPAAPAGPVQCDASLETPIPGEQTQFKITDLKSTPIDNSKLRNSYKLTLASIFQKIEKNYGPLQAKLQVLNPSLNWPQEKTDELRAGGQITNIVDQYTPIVRIMSRFQDSHVSVELPSTAVWRLPIQADYSTGKMLIGAVKSGANQPSGTRLPNVGDEIVAINGQTPAQFRLTFDRWNANANQTTDNLIYALSFGSWSEASGLPLYKTQMSNIELTLQPQDGSQSYKTVLTFEKSGIGLDNVIKSGTQPAVPKTLAAIDAHSKLQTLRQHNPVLAARIERFHNLLRAKIVSPWAMKKDQTQDPDLKGRLVNLGDTTPFFDLPVGFKDLTLPSQLTTGPLAALFDTTFFKAGTFVRNGKTIAFLRIPSFDPADLSTMLPMYRYILGTFEAMKQNGQISQLVIDQTHNPGGYVIMSDLVVKSLVGKYDETKHLRYAVKPTSSFIREFIELRDEISTNAAGLLTDADINDYVPRLDVEINKLLTAQAQGLDLTEPVSMLVMTEYTQKQLDAQMKQVLAQKGQIQGPNGQPVQTTLGQMLQKLLGVDVSTEQVFTGNVDYWIDSLCFSGGDATPATLQDYGRVRLIGIGTSRTAGAGGTVNEFPVDQNISLLLRFTSSLMVRSNDGLVENYGVHADQTVAILPSDIADSGLNLFERAMHQTMDAPGTPAALSLRIRMKPPATAATPKALAPGQVSYKQVVRFMTPQAKAATTTPAKK